jgi:hypothetical protein
MLSDIHTTEGRIDELRFAINDFFFSSMMKLRALLFREVVSAKLDNCLCTDVRTH